MTNSGPANGTTHFVHDRRGNVIAEVNGGGVTVREYLWLPEAEIAPTIGSRTQVDWPVAVVDDVETGTPVVYQVHADHLARPVRMTDAAKATVWEATWLAWGGLHAVSGALIFDLRYPGQWYQLEAGLHYNWHRHYDPTLGRYTQPDPLGFVDGPSVYTYVDGNSIVSVDVIGLSESGSQPRIKLPFPANDNGKINIPGDISKFPPRPQTPIPSVEPPQSRLPPPDFTKDKFCSNLERRCVGIVLRVCRHPGLLSAGLATCFFVRVACVSLRGDSGGGE